MKFLLNMNVNPELGEALAVLGHSCRHVKDIGMARATDSQIVAVAKTDDEVILTHDLDYGQLLAFSGDTSPSVVIFRTTRTNATSLMHRLVACWDRIQGLLALGAIVIVEDGGVRLRPLPIGEPKTT